MSKRPITKKNTSHLDSMIIGCGHSIMVGNVPEVISDAENLSKLNQNFFAWAGTNNDSVQALGFWGGEIDYNTYYPDLKLEDLKPKENEFITPMFRLLSETIVSKNWNPTDFSQGGVLKASMQLLLGQTVNCDHETNIGNAIGSVSKVVWQDAYKDGKFSIPGGINGVLKIDGKANPRIARGILMDPPSIHSNSVTVQFRWEKSHPEMEDRDFYEKLGTYDQHGNMIRRICTEIVRYMETSLVSHGADAYAKKIGADGKIVNPEYASRTWNSYSEYMKDDRRQYYFMDTKSYNFTEDDTRATLIDNPDHNNSNKNDMNELQQFLEKLFGKDMLTLGEGKEATQEEAISLIQALVSDKASLTEKVNTLTTEKDSLTEKVNNLTTENASLKANAEIGKTYATKLRETVVANYKKMQGDKLDEKDPILTMLNAESTPVASLEALNATYETRLAEMFPMTCSKCGSTEISRASSAIEEPKKQDTTKNSEPRDTSDVYADIMAQKNRYKSAEE